MSREDAIEKVKLHEGKFPTSYLGKPLEDILKIDMTLTEFKLTCDKLTNKKYLNVIRQTS